MERKGNMEWVVEEGSYKYQLQSYRNIIDMVISSLFIMNMLVWGVCETTDGGKRRSRLMHSYCWMLHTYLSAIDIQKIINQQGLIIIYRTLYPIAEEYIR